MAEKTRLRCTDPDITLKLPWWPTEVSRTLPAWNVTELERPGRRALAVPTTRTSEEFSMGFTLRNVDYRESVADLLDDLERLAAAKNPAQLLFGDQVAGLFRLDPPQVVIIAWSAESQPSVADVSLTLKRASDAQINVGLVKRIKGRGRNMARTA